ncbi:NAD(P)H nitroreductase [Actinomyces sp. 432]|uniref:nitroreductase family protein n=1 Tax=Actinomyces sp. 432 TaxID=2057798 RepID=UPI001373F314|nr:nitroreductase family protein [Actinomyces sp. 432]QHO90189.1 NAD(P)H nitroreductase [Actinomyces sp. 432]
MEDTLDNDLFELTRRRRSIRRYRGEPVADEVIREIMRVALTAPSSFGHDAVEFIVVRDPDMIRQVGACKTLGGSQVEGAAAVIVTMVKTADTRQAEFWIEDGAIASAYILLAAEQYGLGACWVQIRNRTGRHDTSDKEIRELLGVPSGYTVLNLVAIGEKGELKPAYTDSDLPWDDVHYEGF